MAKALAIKTVNLGRKKIHSTETSFKANHGKLYAAFQSHAPQAGSGRVCG
jgi:hypothetical protein